jgi:Lon protease-like protein
MQKIGIFPLGIVLFPQSLYPLHIFEERYKELVNHCLSSGEVMGINLVSNSKMYEIGCTASVADVFKKYEDGKLDITIEGLKRYRLLNFIDGEKPYFMGEIEYIEEEDDFMDYQKLMDCVEVYNVIVEQIQGFHLDKIKLSNVNTKMPSYLLAQKAGLTPSQKQVLLEINSENKRLDYMYQHLRKITPVIHQADQVNKIIRNDGYLKPDNIR